MGILREHIGAQTKSSKARGMQGNPGYPIENREKSQIKSDYIGSTPGRPNMGILFGEHVLNIHRYSNYNTAP